MELPNTEKEENPEIPPDSSADSEKMAKGKPASVNRRRFIAGAAAAVAGMAFGVKDSCGPLDWKRKAERGPRPEMLHREVVRIAQEVGFTSSEVIHNADGRYLVHIGQHHYSPRLHETDEEFQRMKEDVIV